jgi:hypothetical protein
MKINKTLMAALGAVAIAAAPACANAEVIYYLVGTHHVYRIGPNPYNLVQDRKAIEEQFADDIAAAKAQYDERMNDPNVDPQKESDEFNAYLADRTDQRDQALGELYVQVDGIRERHPELQIEGEGPYQVMGVNYHYGGGVMLFDSYTVFAPWPGYVVEGNPYGWRYGVVYNPFELHSVYLGWHDAYFVAGRPAFFGFVGVGGAVSLNISIGIGGGYAVGGRPIGDFHRFHEMHPDYHPAGAYERFGHPAEHVRGPGGDRRGSGPERRPGERTPYGRPNEGRPGEGRPGGAPRTGGNGGTTRPGGYGNTTRPGGNGEPTRPGGYGNTTRPGGNGEPTRPGGYGNTTRPGGNGEPTRPGGYGNTTRPGGSGNTSRPGGSPPRPSGGSAPKPSAPKPPPPAPPKPKKG